jgi:hypothetical protein
MNVAAAQTFFSACLRHATWKRAHYVERGLSACKLITPDEWECFVAILFDEMGNGRLDGLDLNSHEVKSAERGSSFTYQYHRKSGLSKIDDEMAVDHVMIAYADDYRDADVYVMPKEIMRPFLLEWKESIVRAYHSGKKNQRCRPGGIDYRYVTAHGSLVLAVRGGLLTQVQDYSAVCRDTSRNCVNIFLDETV